MVSTPLKNMKVNWDDKIPNIWENKKWQPNHQPDIVWYPSVSQFYIFLPHSYPNHMPNSPILCWSLTSPTELPDTRPSKIQNCQGNTCDLFGALKSVPRGEVLHSKIFKWFPQMGVLQIIQITTWWFIPLSKWVITPVISGLTPLIPFITRVRLPLTKWDEPPSRPCSSSNPWWLGGDLRF